MSHSIIVASMWPNSVHGSARRAAMLARIPTTKLHCKRPLASISNVNRFQKVPKGKLKLVATDLDGTFMADG